jgi:hypothetical protein
MKKLSLILFIVLFIYSPSTYSMGLKDLIDYYYLIIDKVKGQVSLSCDTMDNKAKTYVGFLWGAKYNIVIKISQPEKILKIEEFNQETFKLRDLRSEYLKYTLWEVNEDEFQIIYDNLIEYSEFLIKINRMSGNIYADFTENKIKRKNIKIGKCKQGSLHKSKKKF